MVKLNKGYNLRIVCALIVLLFLSSFSYSYPLSKEFFLRAPVGESSTYERVKNWMQKGGIVNFLSRITDLSKDIKRSLVRRKFGAEWIVEDGNIAHLDILQKPTFDETRMEVIAIVNIKGHPETIRIKVKRKIPKEEIQSYEWFNDDYPFESPERKERWYISSFKGVTLALEENAYNINYIGTLDIIAISDVIYSNVPYAISYPITESFIRVRRSIGEVDEGVFLNVSFIRSSGYIGHLWDLFNFDLPEDYVAKVSIDAFGHKRDECKRIRELEYALLHASRPEDELIEELERTDRKKRIRHIYSALYEEYDLTYMKRLLKMYFETSNIVKQEYLRGLIFLIPITASVTGKYERTTLDASGRTDAIIDRLSFILPSLVERFEGTELIIRDEGASNGLISEPIFLYLTKAIGTRFKYTAADLVTELVLIEDPDGRTAVFRTNDSLSENLLQLKDKGAIYIPDDRGNVCLPWVDGADVARNFRFAYECYRSNGDMPLGYNAGKINIMLPSVQALSDSDPRFNITQHNILDILPESERAHLTILSNVLIPPYYSAEQALKLLKVVGINTVDGGQALVINELHTYFYYSGTQFVFPYTIFERQGDALVCIEEFGGLREAYSAADVFRVINVHGDLYSISISDSTATPQGHKGLNSSL